MAQHQESHGHSVAAWTGVGILILASVVMAVAVIFANRGLFIAGVVLVVVGVITGKVLAMAGFGVLKGTEGAKEPEPGRTGADSGIS